MYRRRCTQTQHLDRIDLAGDMSEGLPQMAGQCGNILGAEQPRERWHAVGAGVARRGWRESTAFEDRKSVV